MEQIIEGLDNEVALLLFFTTTIIALVVPLYVARIFYPRQSRTRSQAQSSDATVDSSNQNERPSENISTNQTESPPSSTNLASEKQPLDFPPTISRPSETISSDRPTTSANSQETNTNTQNTSSPRAEQEEFLLKVKVQESNYEHFINKSYTLLELKRKFFPRELEEGKQIRFVYAGKILIGDQQKIETFGINKPTVVQCVISEPNSNTTTPGQPQGGGAPLQDTDLDLSMVMYIMYGILLLSSWSMMFLFEDWFSNMGILLLSMLSVFGYFLLL
eukprot:TCONS_00073676-protein